MVNLLVAIFLSGLAVTFTIEFFSLGLGMFFDKEKIYSFLSLPLSFGALVCVQDISKMFIIAVPATAFVVLFINRYINKPVVLTTPRRLPPL